jgi:hypothetical protein
MRRLGETLDPAKAGTFVLPAITAPLLVGLSAYSD